MQNYIILNLILNRKDDFKSSFSIYLFFKFDIIKLIYDVKESEYMFKFLIILLLFLNFNPINFIQVGGKHYLDARYLDTIPYKEEKTINFNNHQITYYNVYQGDGNTFVLYDDTSYIKLDRISYCINLSESNVKVYFLYNGKEVEMYSCKNGKCSYILSRKEALIKPTDGSKYVNIGWICY